MSKYFYSILPPPPRHLEGVQAEERSSNCHPDQANKHSEVSARRDLLSKIVHNPALCNYSSGTGKMLVTFPPSQGAEKYFTSNLFSALR